MSKVIWIICIIIVSVMLAFSSSCSKQSDYKVNVQAEGLAIRYEYSNDFAYYTLTKDTEELARLYIDGIISQEGITVTSVSAIQFFILIPSKYSTEGLTVKCNQTVLKPEMFLDKDTRTTKFSYTCQKPTSNKDIVIEGLDNNIKILDYEIPVNGEVPIYIQYQKGYFAEIKPDSEERLINAGYIAQISSKKAIIKVFYGDDIELFVKNEDMESLSYQQNRKEQTISRVEDMGKATQSEKEWQGALLSEEDTIGGVFCRVYQTVLENTKIIITP